MKSNFGWLTAPWQGGLSRSAVDIPTATPLKKTDFFLSPGRYQLQVASWLGGRTLCRLLFLGAGIFSSLDLSSSSAGCHNLSEFICAPALLYLRGTVSLESSNAFGSCNISTSSSKQTLEP